MLSYSRSHRHNPRDVGQSLLEFAIVLPLLLIVVAGVLDLGRVFFAVIQVTNSAREGARYLSRHPQDRAGSYIATIDAAENETQIDIDVVASCPGDADRCFSGGDATVTVTHNFDLVFGWIFPSPLTITRDATMVVP